MPTSLRTLPFNIAMQRAIDHTNCLANAMDEYMHYTSDAFVMRIECYPIVSGLVCWVSASMDVCTSLMTTIPGKRYSHDSGLGYDGGFRVVIKLDRIHDAVSALREEYTRVVGILEQRSSEYDAVVALLAA